MKNLKQSIIVVRFDNLFITRGDKLSILEKINKLNTSKILNCGYNKGTSVIEVAKEFKLQSPKKVDIVYTNKRKDDLIRIIASNNKIKRFLKWKPKFNNLNTIVKSCISWEKRQ